MEWQQVASGRAKRLMLEDGTAVVALLWDVGGQTELVFCNDAADLEGIDPESHHIGRLPDLIDGLRPEDVIELCCLLRKTSAGGELEGGKAR